MNHTSILKLCFLKPIFISIQKCTTHNQDQNTPCIVMFNILVMSNIFCHLRPLTTACRGRLARVIGEVTVPSRFAFIVPCNWSDVCSSRSLHLFLFFFWTCCSDPVVNNLFHPEVFSSSHLSLMSSISCKYSKAVLSAKGIPVSRDISFATFWA